mgnify:CR=1 FL=1
MFGLFRFLFNVFVAITLTLTSLAVIIELAEGSIDSVLFDNIEIFRDEGRAMACIVFTEEIGDIDTVPIYNFTADNIVFRNIKYNTDMKSKFSAANETNTVNVTVENAAFSKFNSASDNRLMFESDEFANVTYK